MIKIMRSIEYVTGEIRGEGWKVDSGEILKEHRCNAKEFKILSTKSIGNRRWK